MTLRITVYDTETGDTQTSTVAAGDYALITASPCYLDGVQSYPTKGTQVLTVKGRTVT